MTATDGKKIEKNQKNKQFQHKNPSFLWPQYTISLMEMQPFSECKETVNFLFHFRESDVKNLRILAGMV